MRVLQVTTRYYPELQFGGPPQKIHALSRGLVRRGHEVKVLSLHSSHRAGGETAIDGVAVRYLPWLGKGTSQIPTGSGVLADMVRQANLVHCYGLYNLLCPMAAYLAVQARRPFVLEPLGMYVPRVRRLGAKRLYNGLFTGWMARMAARVIATSSGEMAELCDLVEPERLVLRRNGIELEFFEHLPPQETFRTAHDFLDSERMVLYMGRISPIKNLEQLVEAFHGVGVERTRLILAGPMLEPDYARRLHTLIRNLDLADRVSFVGPLYGQEKLAALAAADLFVLPSLFESYGNAAAEAAAAGVPVLLTESCGVAALIHGRAGLAVPVGLASLAKGLRTLLEDDEQRRELTGRRAEVLRELSWEEPLAQTEQLYEELVRN